MAHAGGGLITNFGGSRSTFGREQLPYARGVEASAPDGYPGPPGCGSGIPPPIAQSIRSDPTRVHLDRSEHRGGVCSQHGWSLPQAPAHRVRLSRRGRMPHPPSWRARLPPRRGGGGAERYAGRGPAGTASPAAPSPRNRRPVLSHARPRTTHHALLEDFDVAISARPFPEIGEE